MSALTYGSQNWPFELDTKMRLFVAIDQPKVSALEHHKVDGFSDERLMTCLTALGSGIELRFRAPQRAFAP